MLWNKEKKHGLEFNPELVLKLFQFGLDNRNFSIFSFTYK